MKVKALLFYGAALLVLALVASVVIINTGALGGGQRGDNFVVAKVDGHEITRADIHREMSPFADEFSDPGRMRAAEKTTLDTLIQRQILLDEAERRGITVSDEEIEAELEQLYDMHSREQLIEQLRNSGFTLADFRQAIGHELIKENLVKAIRQELAAKLTVTDDEIAAYYEDNRRLYDTSEVAHIYLKIPPPGEADDVEKTLKRARQLISRLRRGASFAELARENSDDMSTKNADGYIGPIDQVSLPRAFLEVVEGLKPGEFSGEPLQIQNGVHIIKRLNEKYRGLDEVSEEIRQTLFESKLESEVENYLAELREKADIKIMLQ